MTSFWPLPPFLPLCRSDLRRFRTGPGARQTIAAIIEPRQNGDENRDVLPVAVVIGAAVCSRRDQKAVPRCLMCFWAWRLRGAQRGSGSGLPGLRCCALVLLQNLCPLGPALRLGPGGVVHLLQRQATLGNIFCGPSLKKKQLIMSVCFLPVMDAG